MAVAEIDDVDDNGVGYLYARFKYSINDIRSYDDRDGIRIVFE